MESSYRNLHGALPHVLWDLLEYGNEVTSRAGKVKEFTAHTSILYNAVERVQTLPYRHASPPAQVAETLWLLAGRSDIHWLSHYLPRAPLFSDDGLSWRAAYGPRLRDWPNMQANGDNVGIDQLDLCQKLLQQDHGTRQAVLSIWDPARDLGVVSKDIPCNDTIQFLERDGRLDMHVFVRSNDVWWGWSGINTFAWSVLLEAMAYWTGVKPGHLVTFAGSWHLYERHWARARQVANLQDDLRVGSVYANRPEMLGAPWRTPFADLDYRLEQLFCLESASRRHKHEAVSKEAVSLMDPWLMAAVQVLNVHNAVRYANPAKYVLELVKAMPDCDLTHAVDQWLGSAYRTKEASA